jgi:hypothetical protein
MTDESADKNTFGETTESCSASARTAAADNDRQYLGGAGRRCAAIACDACGEPGEAKTSTIITGCFSACPLVAVHP